MWPQQRQSHIQPTRVYSKLAPSDPLKAQFRKSDQAELKEQASSALYIAWIYILGHHHSCVGHHVYSGTACLSGLGSVQWKYWCLNPSLWLCICVFVFVNLYLCRVQPLLLWITAWPAPSLIAISSAIDIDIILISTVNTTIVLSVVRFGIHCALWESPEVPLF